MLHKAGRAPCRVNPGELACKSRTQPGGRTLTNLERRWRFRVVTKSAFERLGGEWALRAVINDFVDEMMDDAMIGFFFRGVDRFRLRDKEYELSAVFLGAKIRYTGRGLRAAHRKHPIMGGQFDRRRQILVEAMHKHRVPEDVAEQWLGHVDAMRSQVTQDEVGQCRPPPTS